MRGGRKGSLGELFKADKEERKVNVRVAQTNRVCPKLMAKICNRFFGRYKKNFCYNPVASFFTEYPSHLLNHANVCLSHVLIL